MSAGKVTRIFRTDRSRRTKKGRATLLSASGGAGRPGTAQVYTIKPIRRALYSKKTHTHTHTHVRSRTGYDGMGRASIILASQVTCYGDFASFRIPVLAATSHTVDRVSSHFRVSNQQATAYVYIYIDVVLFAAKRNETNTHPCNVLRKLL